MNRRLRRGLLVLLVLLAGSAPFRSRADPSGQLGSFVSTYLAQPAFRHATWAVVVASAHSGEIYFATNGAALLKPASNAKLFTAALALHRFGPDYRIASDLIPTGRLTRRGTLLGNLVVYGRGDFSWAARFAQDRSEHALDPLVDTLRQAGIRRIRGGIVADDSCFQGPGPGHGWTWNDLQYYYGAEAGALNVDDNVVDLLIRPGAHVGAPLIVEELQPAAPATCVLDDAATGPAGALRRVVVRRDPGSPVIRISGTLPIDGPPWKDAVSVPTPGARFAMRLTDSLRRAGIAVRSAPRHEPGAAARALHLPEAPTAMTVHSPPLGELVRHMMKPSHNLYAQLLLLHTGSTVPPIASDESTETRGLRALRGFLDEASIPAEEVLLDEGSGLSRGSLVTADAVVRLLRFMDRHPHREAFLAALPVAGTDGTLRRRLGEPPLVGNVHAKTGTLRYVDTLSGFLTNRAGERLVFSIFLNAYAARPGDPTGREAIDQVVGLVARSTP